MVSDGETPLNRRLSKTLRKMADFPGVVEFQKPSWVLLYQKGSGSAEGVLSFGYKFDNLVFFGPDSAIDQYPTIRYSGILESFNDSRFWKQGGL